MMRPSEIAAVVSEIASPSNWATRIVREHLGNASHLLSTFRDSVFSIQPGNAFERFCRRCDDNLDGLRIWGERAIELAYTCLEDEPETASALSILLAESESGQPDRAKEAVALLYHESLEVRQAARQGLRLASPRYTEPHLQATLKVSEPQYASAGALEVLAFHRLPFEADERDWPLATSDEVAWLLAEGWGRSTGYWDARKIAKLLASDSQQVRESALRASARLGWRELIPTCRQAAQRMDSSTLECLEFLGAVGSMEDSQLLRRAALNSATATAAIRGLGRLGHVTDVPFLLDLLTEVDTARSAAAAIERITGGTLPRSTPARTIQADLDFDDVDAPIEINSARDWWSANKELFDHRKHWQSGYCISDAPLGDVFELLPTGIRYDVYLRQRVYDPSTPDWEIETWPWKIKNPRFTPS